MIPLAVRDEGTFWLSFLFSKDIPWSPVIVSSSWALVSMPWTYGNHYPFVLQWVGARVDKGEYTRAYTKNCSYVVHACNLSGCCSQLVGEYCIVSYTQGAPVFIQHLRFMKFCYNYVGQLLHNIVQYFVYVVAYFLLVGVTTDMDFSYWQNNWYPTDKPMASSNGRVIST